MCGHATVGALWLLNRVSRLPRDHVRIATLSGIVQARITTSGIEISQPKGRLEDLPDANRSTAAILSVLGIDETALAPQPIRNASTSRMKTLIPLKSVAILDGLRPDRTVTGCWLGGDVRLEDMPGR